MVAKDTSYGSETYRPYLDIERIINVQSAGSVNRGHDPIPYLVGNYDTIGLAYGITVSGNYAYVADENNGLVILRTDISSTNLDHNIN